MGRRLPEIRLVHQGLDRGTGPGAGIREDARRAAPSGARRRPQGLPVLQHQPRQLQRLEDGPRLRLGQRGRHVAHRGGHLLRHRRQLHAGLVAPGGAELRGQRVPRGAAHGPLQRSGHDAGRHGPERRAGPLAHRAVGDLGRADDPRQRLHRPSAQGRHAGAAEEPRDDRDRPGRARPAGRAGGQPGARRRGLGQAADGQRPSRGAAVQQLDEGREHGGELARARARAAGAGPGARCLGARQCRHRHRPLRDARAGRDQPPLCDPGRRHGGRAVSAPAPTSRARTCRPAAAASRTRRS